jgi:hypothetical protein
MRRRSVHPLQGLVSVGATVCVIGCGARQHRCRQRRPLAKSRARLTGGVAQTRVCSLCVSTTWILSEPTRQPHGETRSVLVRRGGRQGLTRLAFPKLRSCAPRCSGGTMRPFQRLWTYLRRLQLFR